jgi:uncharacterized protein (TIGR03437 family)
LRQNNVNTPVPIQSIQGASLCPNSFDAVRLTCGSLAAITVQIPYEISADATLFVSQNGQAGMAIELIPVSDQVHVLTECDIVIGGGSFLGQPNLTGLPCTPVVTHANGIRVNAFTPANVGEELTAWVFGLGQTNPPSHYGPALEAGSCC